MTTAVETHHRVPRCLLRLRDRAEAHPELLNGEGIQLWLDFEVEAMRFGVDPDISCEGLRAMVENSTVEIPAEEHRNGHAEDFVRWGRRGGLCTRRRYGTAWFSLLARRRWNRVSRELLAETFAVLGGGAGGKS